MTRGEVTQLARGEIAELGMPRSAVASSAPGGHDPLSCRYGTFSARVMHDGGRMPSMEMKNGPVRRHVACISWGRLLGYERCHPAGQEMRYFYLVRSCCSPCACACCVLRGESLKIAWKEARRALISHPIPVQRCSRSKMSGGKVSQSGD